MSVPLGSLQTRLIAGQIPDWSGYEYLQPTQNKLITHNLLFDFTLPTAYTGAGMEITEGKWIIKSMLANMNASRRTPGNTTPVLAYRVDYSRGEFQGFGFAGVHGKAANFADPNGSRFARRPVRSRWLLHPRRLDAARATELRHAEEGRDRARPGDRRAARRQVDRRCRHWRPTSSRRASRAPRAIDYIKNDKNGGGLLGFTGYWDPANGSLGDNRNGIGVDPTLDCVTDPTIAECNRGANRSALTFGLSYLFDLNTTFKVEYRLDSANLPVFANVKDGTFRKNNSCSAPRCWSASERKAGHGHGKHRLARARGGGGVRRPCSHRRRALRCTRPARPSSRPRRSTAARSARWRAAARPTSMPP